MAGDRVLIVGKGHPATGHTGVIKAASTGRMAELGLAWIVEPDGMGGHEVGAAEGELRRLP